MSCLKSKKNNRFLNNTGSTMLETLVSFVILMIVLAALTAMIRFAIELRMRSEDVSRVYNSFNAEVYKDTPAVNVKTYDYKGISAGDDYTMFTLKLDESTSPRNIEVNTGKEGWVEADKSNNYFKSLSLPRIDATGYESTDPLISSEHIVTPKVLMFKYNKVYQKTN